MPGTFAKLRGRRARGEVEAADDRGRSASSTSIDTVILTEAAVTSTVTSAAATPAAVAISSAIALRTAPV